MVAFEMAQQLTAQGQAIGLLALLDTYPSRLRKTVSQRSDAACRPRSWLEQGPKRTSLICGNSQVNEGIEYVIKKARFAPRKMKSQVWRRIYQTYENFNRPLPR